MEPGAIEASSFESAISGSILQGEEETQVRLPSKEKERLGEVHAMSLARQSTISTGIEIVQKAKFPGAHFLPSLSKSSMAADRLRSNNPQVREPMHPSTFPSADGSS